MSARARAAQTGLDVLLACTPGVTIESGGCVIDELRNRLVVDDRELRDGHALKGFLDILGDGPAFP